MPEQLLDYKQFATLRDRLAGEYSSRINMSSNAQLVFSDVYGKTLEDGRRETIAERMAAVAVDVASNDVKYLPTNLTLEEKTKHIETRAKRYLEMYTSNTFRANTPTNINFGRWAAVYNDDGDIISYEMKNQLGSACFVVPVEDMFGDNVETIHQTDGILAAWVEQQLLQKGGGGTGFSGASLRPKGSKIGYNPAVDGMNSMDWKNQRGVSSGWESFLDNYYNSSTEAVKQGSSRRGANMGIQRIDHMDFLDHLYAKFGRDRGRLEYRLKNFNLSIAGTDEFMEAALSGGTYTLYNPHRANPKTKKILQKKFGIENPEIVRKGDLATREQFEKIMRMNESNPFAPVVTPNMYLDNNGKDVINAYNGEEIGTVINDIVHINAAKVLDSIAKLSHSNGEPGMLFIDRINEYNPILFIEEIEATNPCGEQPLPRHTACNLGSINAGKFVRYAIIEEKSATSFVAENGRIIHVSPEEIAGQLAEVGGKYSSIAEKIRKDSFAKIEKRGDGTLGVMYYDWESLDQTVEDGIRFLDNVVDRSDFPSKKVTDAVNRTRKVGLGYMGVWDAMVLMKKRYGSDESYKFGEALAKRLHDKSRETSMKLAEERGVFPVWDKSFFNPDSEHFKWFMGNPATIRDRYRGERKLSDKIKRRRDMLYGVKVRNEYQTTQAPTGTIRRTVGEKDLESKLYTNDNLAISSGVEPFYSLEEESKIINTRIKDFSLAAYQLLKRENLDSSEIIDAIKKNRGSVNIYSYTPKEVSEVLNKIPEDIREVLVTAAGGEKDIYEISPEQHVKMASIFQKWTDSAISKTNNLPNSATVGDMRKAWINLWTSGSKGGTFYRDSSREFQILNTVVETKENVKTNGKVKRPLLQRSITLEMPYNTSVKRDGVGEIDFDPERCFTTLTFNMVNGHLTGVFQNIPEVDPERISLLTSANIELSRTLKNGRALDDIITDLEKVRLEGSRRGVVIDEAVMNGSSDKLRYQVEGSTTRGDLLNALYVVKFLTDGGEKFNPEFMNERIKSYELGEITLRSIINTRGEVRIEEDEGAMPSILGHRKVIKVPQGMSEKLCPECG
ncbi:MAG: adenosylcobalamin-dependent ribonucleoside-diphosphate reductase [Nanoarchaeota archaeon]